jgi:hypothetical protein
MAAKIVSHVANKGYRNNWDETFRSATEEETNSVPKPDLPADAVNTSSAANTYGYEYVVWHGTAPMPGMKQYRNSSLMKKTDSFPEALAFAQDFVKEPWSIYTRDSEGNLTLVQSQSKNNDSN